jgi:5'-3' exonuclease
MGIPSYYKKLCDRIPGLLQKRIDGQKPSHLWIDFNCMIYHCLHRPDAKPYTGEHGRIEWENQFILDICKYLKKIVKLVNPTEQVFVGVDGVVPMAKIRQQRLRRFKSLWVAEEEKRLGKSENGERWDTNAITPGTAFMERLGAALKAIPSSESLKWIVSTAEEPGEGEHKAMNGIRNCVNKKCHVIYGLDADLIILSLLQPVETMWLFREEIHEGKVKYIDNKEESYTYFGIHSLRDYLCHKKDKDYLLDYCMAMSFVGNDFLPHGLSLKLKEGAHDIILEVLSKVRPRVGPFIEKVADGSFQWKRKALIECLQYFADNEERWIETICEKKIRIRNTSAKGETSLEIALDEWNKIPLRAAEELAIICKNGEGGWKLTEFWKSVYNERWLKINSAEAGIQYLKGLDWILQYYTGKKVNTEWCYPWFVPPLWCDLLAVIQSAENSVKAPEINEKQLMPQEQLALVLPLQSWWLVRDKDLKVLPRLAPQLWINKFELFTAGRTMTWECEAQIPLFFPERLRYLITQGNRQ